MTPKVVASDPKYPTVNGYDPTKCMADATKELLCHEYIKQGGNKRRSYAIIYGIDGKIPRSKSNMPYVIFSGKMIQARCQYLLDQHLEGVGLDTKNLLAKSAKLIDAAVTKRDITGFATMVNTILKLRGEDVIKIAQVNKNLTITDEDFAAVEELFTSD